MSSSKDDFDDVDTNISWYIFLYMYIGIEAFRMIFEKVLSEEKQAGIEATSQVHFFWFVCSFYSFVQYYRYLFILMRRFVCMEDSLEIFMLFVRVNIIIIAIPMYYDHYCRITIVVCINAFIILLFIPIGIFLYSWFMYVNTVL